MLNKNTHNAGWWLKIKSLAELTAYLEQTNARYGRAFDNYLHDNFYQPAVSGHGKHIEEANLTLAAYLYGANRGMSMIEALTKLASNQASRMANMLDKHGAIYINSHGGWNYGGEFAVYNGDFYHSEHLTWPMFSEQDIKISKFPGGQHFYARVGLVDVKSGNRTKFNSYQEAKQAALAYLN